MNKALISIVMLTAVAHADVRHDLDSLDRNLQKVAPAPGRATAPVRPPPWCGAVKGQPSSGPDAIARFIETDDLIKAAELTCAWPKEPVVQRAVAAIEQSWINETGLAEPDALASLQARLDHDRFDADKKRLCDALTVPDEVGGSVHSFTEARRTLFGCGMSEPMWNTRTDVPTDVQAYLELETDELARLALVLHHGRVLTSRITQDDFLVSYVVDGLDYRELAAPSVLRALDAAPYQGNGYARIVILESLGRARTMIDAIDAAVKAKSADADWKELLVTAPQRGIAEWNKLATTYKAELARSNEFERKVFGPSKKALAGCHGELRADFLRVIGTLKHDTVNDFKTALGHPIAGLLFDRLAACMAVDTDPMVASQIIALRHGIGVSRGPRAAAYRAAVEALGKILEDRTKFSVSPSAFGQFALRDVGLDEIARKFVSSRSKEWADPMGFVLDGENGIVEHATKSANGVKVTFPTKSWSYMEQACTPTNRLIQILRDGTLVYEQRCRDIGMKTETRKPPDITVATELAAGIAPGAYIEFITTRNRITLPTAVFSDKSRKKLVAYYGFKL